MSRLLMMKGLPASGKSTKAFGLVNHGQWVRVNKDDLRAMLHNSKWSKNNEKYVISLRDKIIEDNLRQGNNVVVDDTNFAPKHESVLRELAKREKADFEVMFFNVPVEECLRRNIQRPVPVREEVIWKMYNQYLKPKAEVYIPPEGKPLAIIVDIDGTLAHRVDRSPYDWSKVDEDTVDEIVSGIVNLHEDNGINVILVSGRDSICMDETENWLDYHEISYHELFMRPEGDNRNDAIVKREIFDENIRDNYQVVFVLDDRNRVVDMWREIGLKCLQVAEGNF